MAHNPADDYKFWLVVNPAQWLVPIFLALLAVAVVVHIEVLNSAKYNWISGPAKVAVK
ncbi:light-harvesting antenna LH1, alpha subunit [Rhodopila globiformis]|uniref:Light-harvesting protein n=1 Tax=Rhodopila globiformis TaxID=1071 RepID=A0A2S6N383_RHOGL|nr:light-harvesting antenna LH1, alpha subunit [Rhodopila globiformis]PPQ29073.1 light-harvesting protein [Rhodopila globiformis]